jgi:hypothetical protein
MRDRVRLTPPSLPRSPSWAHQQVIKVLWRDEGILRTFEEKSKFQLNDSAEYYFEAIDRLMAPEYVATVDDILRSRVRTSGIVEEKYRIDGVGFMCVGVGVGIEEEGGGNGA